MTNWGLPPTSLGRTYITKKIDSYLVINDISVTFLNQSLSLIILKMLYKAYGEYFICIFFSLALSMDNRMPNALRMDNPMPKAEKKPKPVAKVRPFSVNGVEVSILLLLESLNGTSGR